MVESVSSRKLVVLLLAYSAVSFATLDSAVGVWPGSAALSGWVQRAFVGHWPAPAVMSLIVVIGKAKYCLL